MENFKYHPDRIKHVPGQEGPVNDPEKAEIMAEIEDEYRNLADMYEEYLTRPEIFLEQYPAVSPRVERYRKLEKAEEEYDAYQAAQQADANKKVIFSISFGKNADEKPPESPKHEMAILSGDPEVREYLDDPEKYLDEHPTTSDELNELRTMQHKGISGDYIRRIGEMAAELKGAAEDYEMVAQGKSTEELKKDRRRAWKNLTFGTIGALFASRGTDLADSQKLGHVDLKQNPDFFNAQQKIQLGLAIKDTARDELARRRPGPNYDYPANEKAFETFIPKIRAFAEKQTLDIREPELNELIDEIHGIELPGRGTGELYGTLLDLRDMLFTTDQVRSDRLNTADRLMNRLRAILRGESVVAPEKYDFSKGCTVKSNRDMPFLGVSEGQALTLHSDDDGVLRIGPLSWSPEQLGNEIENGVWTLEKLG